MVKNNEDTFYCPLILGHNKIILVKNEFQKNMIF